MADIKVGDKVRVKDRKDWPSPPGYRLANTEGTVIKWVETEKVMDEFQDYVHVKVENSPAEEFIGLNVVFLAENLEKI
jgi:aminopeptidase N